MIEVAQDYSTRAKVIIGHPMTPPLHLAMAKMAPLAMQDSSLCAASV